MSAFSTPLFALLLTLTSYRLAWWVYERTGRHPLAHPFLLAMIPVIVVLLALGISYRDYLAGTAVLQFFLGPATVALAWPLYRQLSTLRHIWRQVTLYILIGAPLAAGLAIALAAICGAPADVVGSLAPKSITTPIALEVSRLTGGYPALAAGAVAITGIVGVLAAPLVFRLFRITDDRIRGLALGLVAHAIGTARAFEYGERAGAYSSLALGLTGLLTALALPWLWPWIAGLL
ncbi:MAG: LrgB family protein [Alcanivoracaceae bacterium]|jgi:predicted murein hydrolase (TIGR00659 family)|nr:LrgB family protein [Alcanivoracaceae bacterium]